MTRLLPMAAILAMFLAVTNASEAKGGKGGNGGNSSHGSHAGSKGSHAGSKGMGHGNSHGNHNGGHSYGRGYNRWSSRYWNSRYGCDFFYSDIDSCYFYFYAPADCYYPVSYINQYPPAASPGAGTAPIAAPNVQVTNVNQNTLANGAVPIPMPRPVP